VNDRCGRGASSTDGDYATPENQLKGSRQSRYFEVVMTDTADDNWGWVRGATNYRSAALLIRNLIDCTSKGGNFVLNTGPMANGEFSPEHVALINEIGSWMDVNGEAIYGTSPAPEVETSTSADFICYATKKDREIYLHVVKWPDAPGKMAVVIHRTGFMKAKLLDAKLKGFHATADEANGVTTVELQKPERVDPYATVIRLDFKTD
jgi:alpha-L-fucosidase